MSTSPDTSPPPGLAPLEEGDLAWIGPYRVVGRIGSGGMGAVYGALDGQGVCVAVKTVHADFARRPRFREAFAREVEMLGRAGGISTARLHAADTGAAVPWLAFDYVPGRDLRAHVRAFGPLEGEMLRTFALGTAEGLAALHAAGIAHRDIKPGNVILSPDGPKIVDFGIAAEIGTERSEDGSASYGTPGWSAPERYSGAAADPAADVFAWGGLVALAATGRQPFGTGDAGEKARRVREGEYDVDGVPEDLLGPVRAALSVDPARRPSSEALVRSLLPEPQEGEEGQRGPVTTANVLRRMLRDYWRGVDDAGHDPARWAAALGIASVAGLGASAVGSGALGPGALGSGGAAGTGAAGTGAAGAGTAGGTGAAGTTAAGSGMATAGGAGGAASGGAAGTGTTTGGVLSGVATSKIGLAGAGLLAVAGLAAGGFVVYEQVSENPSETVAAAAGLLEEGPGFTARVERAFSRSHAERVSERTGTPVDQVVADSRSEEEYLYSADGESFLIRGPVMGPGTTAVANHQGELYVYASREEAPGLWEESPHEFWFDSALVDVYYGQEGDHGLWRTSPAPLESAPGVDADSIAPSLVTAPLRALAEEGGAEAVDGPGRAYTGSTVLGLLSPEALVEEEVVGRVELDDEGAPVRAEYTSDRWEVRVDFEEVDTVVPLEDPQVWAADNDGFGWVVVHAPVCGTVRLPRWAEDNGGRKEWEVQASGWGMDCDQAMEVAELREDPSIDPDRAVVLDARRGRMSRITQYDDMMACGVFWREEQGVRPDGSPPESYYFGPCQESTVLSEDRSSAEDGYFRAEVEFGPVALIDFHQRS
ncbi:protein kinase domain-containing protein [Nocardiopsis terrae]